MRIPSEMVQVKIEKMDYHGDRIGFEKQKMRLTCAKAAFDYEDGFSVNLSAIRSSRLLLEQ